MSLFDALFGWTKPRELKVPEQPMYTTVTVTETKPVKPRKPRVKKPKPEPVAPPAPEVKVIKMDFDLNNPRLGSMELDWNDQFIELLKQHGYQGASPEDLVDAWLNDICRNIISNPFPGGNVTSLDAARYVRRQDLGDGKTEVS